MSVRSVAGGKEYMAALRARRPATDIEVPLVNRRRGWIAVSGEPGRYVYVPHIEGIEHDGNHVYMVGVSGRRWMCAAGETCEEVAQRIEAARVELR